MLFLQGVKLNISFNYYFFIIYSSYCHEAPDELQNLCCAASQFYTTV